MGDKLVRKGLVVGIIFLFIGAGVYPAIAVKLNTSTNTIDKVENKEKSINDISNFNLDRLNLLMFLSMKPKFFISMVKSCSKISNDLYKLSSKDCLEKVNKMVKEKLSMTLKILKIIESKSLINSSKMKSNYKDIYLKISEILSKCNESISVAETQSGPLIICLILGGTISTLEHVMYSIELIIKFTDNELVRNFYMKINAILYILWESAYSLFFLLNCLDYPSELSHINCFEGENHE